MIAEGVSSHQESGGKGEDCPTQPSANPLLGQPERTSEVSGTVEVANGSFGSDVKDDASIGKLRRISEMAVRENHVLVVKHLNMLEMTTGPSDATIKIRNAVAECVSRSFHRHHQQRHGDVDLFITPEGRKQTAEDRIQTLRGSESTGPPVKAGLDGRDENEEREQTIPTNADIHDSDGSGKRIDEVNTAKRKLCFVLERTKEGEYAYRKAKQERSTDVDAEDRSCPSEAERQLPPEWNRRRTPTTTGPDPEEIKRRRIERDAVHKNLEAPTPPECSCPQGKECGPFYDHIGHGTNEEEIRLFVETDTEWKGREIRFEEIFATDEKGVNCFGCPIAKWELVRASLNVLWLSIFTIPVQYGHSPEDFSQMKARGGLKRHEMTEPVINWYLVFQENVLKRTGEEEKLLVVIKRRPNHVCERSVIVVAWVIWEGVGDDVVCLCYGLFSRLLPGRAKPDHRECAQNSQKTCCCQGVLSGTKGSSFSFGCAWYRFNGACRFSGAQEVKKFAMKNKVEDETVKSALTILSRRAAELVKLLTPQAFENMTRHSQEASDCRIGDPEDGPSPFSGSTVCMDFATHPHMDKHNMHKGVTVVLSLGLSDGQEAPEEGVEENNQLHVLCQYGLKMDPVDDGAPCSESGGNPGVKKLEKFVTKSRILKKGQTTAGGKNRGRGKPTAKQRLLAAQLNPTGAWLHPDGGAYDVFDSENVAQIHDPDVGGVAILLTPGSVLLEAAKYETHATTALSFPNCRKPRRISVICYQHQSLNLPNHGCEYVQEMKARNATRNHEDDEPMVVPSSIESKTE